MLEEFLSYIEKDLSISEDNKVLLAVSGGVDSMVMLHLFESSSISFQVAHIDHDTRNGDSTSDAQFVQDYCAIKKIKYHIKKLDYNELSHGNFQQNARLSRYKFFQQLLTDHGLSYVATAHHLDDRWETFLTNLNRKAGLTGLTSLRPKVNQTIRPLLLFQKEEIVQYALQHDLPYRHDKSNDEDAYLRNQIRHHINPAIKGIFPNFIQNANATIQHLQSADDMIGELIAKLHLVTKTKSHMVIDLTQLHDFSNGREVLYYIISPFGFTASDCGDMFSSTSTGALFHSKSHEILINRGMLLLRKIKTAVKNNIDIVQEGLYTLQDGRLLRYGNSQQDDVVADIDLAGVEDIQLPVTIRSIEPGDKYYPSHMNGKSKSVKKYLTDLKVHRFAKEKVLVIVKETKVIQILSN